MDVSLGTWNLGKGRICAKRQYRHQPVYGFYSHCNNNLEPSGIHKLPLMILTKSTIHHTKKPPMVIAIQIQFL